ncbi:MAG: STM3941 family protein, partial [Janthinobacterium lividum]
TEQVEIPLSKSKMTVLLIGSTAFVAIGLWFVISPPILQNGFFSNPALILVSGIASILFFGFCGFILLKKLQDNNVGLIIDKTGITDNASGISAGHIPWSDINEIKTSQVMNQKFLMILVSNPDTYINRQTSTIKRKAAEMNYKSYGLPISISANTLKCNFNHLKNTLQDQLDKNRI